MDSFEGFLRFFREAFALHGERKVKALVDQTIKVFLVSIQV
jgi:hypothetical protein